jgi:transposase
MIILVCCGGLLGSAGSAVGPLRTRHLSRRLERDLLSAGECIVRVPPKLMAHVRDSARTYGKSDPIDALAVARAAQREPDLPMARLDGPERELRLLVDYRESLVAERTRLICRLRWHLHELDRRGSRSHAVWMLNAH